MLFANVFKAVAIEGIGQLGPVLGLDARLTNLISLSVGAIGGDVIQNPGTTLEEAFNNIKPELFSSLASYGIDRLGSSLGWDPRLTSIVGSGVGGVVNVAFQGGIEVGERIIQEVKDQVVGGAIRYGLEFSLDKMEVDSSLLRSLASNVVTASISSLLDPNGNLLNDILEKAQENTVDMLERMASPDFARLVVEMGGIDKALEATATSVFSRSALEDISKAGGIAQLISGHSKNVDIDGITLRQVTVNSKESFFLDKSDNLVAIKQTNGTSSVIHSGKFIITSNGAKLSEGVIGTIHPDGSISTIEVRDGKTYQISVSKTPGTSSVTTHEGPEGQTWITFDIPQDQADVVITQNETGILNINGTQLLDGSLIYKGLGYEINIDNGYGTSISRTSSSNPVEAVPAVKRFLFGNGFENEERLENTHDPLMKDYIENLEDDTLIDRAKEIIVDLYELTKLIGNGIDWITDFPTQEIQTILSVIDAVLDFDDETKSDINKLLSKLGDMVPQKIKDYLRNYWGIGNNLLLETISEIQQKGVLKDAIAFVHSGATAPVLTAIETMQYDVETVLIFEGPHPDYKEKFTNTNLKRIIHVMGSNHGLLNSLMEGDAPVPYLNWAQFDGVNHRIENINIEIKGAWHSDYSYDPAYWEKKIEETYGRTPLEQEVNRRLVRVQQERNRKVNLFMRDLYEAALDPDDLTNFLLRPDVPLDSDDIYKIDLDVYHSNRS